jgi:parallel beta-helix repeat protein
VVKNKKMKAKEREKLFSLVKVSFLKKSFLTTILVISVLAVFTAAVAGAGDQPCTCGDICVNETGWWRADADFNASSTPIQHAIDNATEGNTICVNDGTYNENVDVTVSHLTIKSENGSANCIVNALVNTSGVFIVSADYVNISGFTVTGASGWKASGILLYNISHCNISNNNVSNNRYGIYLKKSSNNMLVNNTANSNNEVGIYLYSSSNNTLTNNTANSNDWGIIILWDSSNNTLTNNTMSENKYNFGVFGEDLSDYIQSIDTSNTVDGKPIYYWVDEQDKQIPNDAGFVGLVNSTNIMVKDLTLTKNVEGMLLAHSNSSRIENVTTSNNDDYGIYLYSSSNNTLTNNTFVNDGLFVSASYHNTVESNTVNGKPLLYLEDASDYKVKDVGQVILVNCDNVSIEDLDLSNTSVGVELWKTTNSVITGNTANSSAHCGIYLGFSSNNTLTNNTANSNSYDPSYRRGICLYYSSNNTLTDNTASNNTGGIYLEDSSNNILTNNTASNNRWGIYLYQSSNNPITDNNVSNNFNYGIRLEGSSDNTFINNIVSNNTNYDFHSDEFSRSNAVNDLTIANYPTTISFIYDNGIEIKSVTTPDRDRMGCDFREQCQHRRELRLCERNELQPDCSVWQSKTKTNANTITVWIRSGIRYCRATCRSNEIKSLMKHGKAIAIITLLS